MVLKSIRQLVSQVVTSRRFGHLSLDRYCQSVLVALIGFSKNFILGIYTMFSRVTMSFRVVVATLIRLRPTGGLRSFVFHVKQRLRLHGAMANEGQESSFYLIRKKKGQISLSLTA